MGAFDGEHVVVVGAGVAGSAAARVLLAEGATVRVSDSGRATPGASDLRAEGIEVLDGGHALDHLDGATMIVTSPGCRRTEILRWAHDRTLPVWGEIELGARLARVPYLAVTGTNGKTTTTGMLAACLRSAGLDAVACGNIGLPFPTAARSRDALVVEVSSFQLATQTSFHRGVSVLLNLAPDHLDWHGSFDAYAAAKARVFALQGAADVHVGNLDDEASAAISRSAPCEVRWFTIGEPARTGRASVTAAWPPGGATGSRCALARYAGDARRCGGCRHRGPRVCDRRPRDQGGDRDLRAGTHRGEPVATVDGVRAVDNSKRRTRTRRSPRSGTPRASS